MPRYVGVMSGTSMDALDVVLVRLDGGTAELQSAVSTPWPAMLRERLQKVAAGTPLSATALAGLDSAVGDFIGETVSGLMRNAGIDASEVAAIGCHGQTVAHSPNFPNAATLQLGDANRIAERTGVTTINDFRRRDMAAGGQGAPLAPAFHAAMLRAPGESRVVLNLGGIANITVLPGETGEPVIGFDTGPANCLMDAWTRRHLGQPFDRDGSWAASAKADKDLLHRLLSDPYFGLATPKSTGTQYFSHTWLRQALDEHPPVDPATVQATLLALTVHSVADAVRQSAPDTRRLLVCGGGVHNCVLLTRLADALQLPVESTEQYGISPRWMEAMAFAWLARETLSGRPGNLPDVTGARGRRVLGAIHPA